MSSHQDVITPSNGLHSAPSPSLPTPSAAPSAAPPSPSQDRSMECIHSNTKASYESVRAAAEAFMYCLETHILPQGLRRLDDEMSKLLGLEQRLNEMHRLEEGKRDELKQRIEIVSDVLRKARAAWRVRDESREKADM